MLKSIDFRSKIHRRDGTTGTKFTIHGSHGTLQFVDVAVEHAGERTLTNVAVRYDMDECGRGTIAFRFDDVPPKMRAAMRDASEAEPGAPLVAFAIIDVTRCEIPALPWSTLSTAAEGPMTVGLYGDNVKAIVDGLLAGYKQGDDEGSLADRQEAFARGLRDLVKRTGIALATSSELGAFGEMRMVDAREGIRSDYLRDGDCLVWHRGGDYVDHDAAPERTMVAIGDRVIAKRYPSMDREYVAEAVEQRVLCNGLTGVVQERGTGHGLCFLVHHDIGLKAWWEPEELTLAPREPPASQPPWSQGPTAPHEKRDDE